MDDKKEKFKPTPEQRETLLALLELEKGYKSSAEFVKECLPCGASMWSQIKDTLDADKKTCYFDAVSAEATAEVFRKLAVALIDARRQSAQENVDILEISQLRAVDQSVRECKGKTSPERITLYIADTGGGKTIIANHLERVFSATTVQTRQPWCKSEYTALKDIGAALGARNMDSMITATLEDALVKAISSRSVVLTFDEAEYFGGDSLNLVKMLLNRTSMRAVIMTTHAGFQKWERRYRDEADQIKRRVHSTVRLTGIDPKDAALFFPEGQFSDEDKALRLISEHAGKFGNYSMVRRVADRLRGVKKAGPTDVEKAINGASSEMNTPGLAGTEKKR